MPGRWERTARAGQAPERRRNRKVHWVASTGRPIVEQGLSCAVDGPAGGRLFHARTGEMSLCGRGVVEGSTHGGVGTHLISLKSQQGGFPPGGVEKGERSCAVRCARLQMALPRSNCGPFQGHHLPRGIPRFPRASSCRFDPAPLARRRGPMQGT